MSVLTQALLQTWWAQSAGQQLFANECQLARTLLGTQAGAVMLQVGGLPMDAAFWQTHCWPLQGWLIDAQGPAIRRGVPLLRVDWATLPLETAGVDSYWLPHTLEVLDDPQPLLGELARTLAPGGRLWVAMLNPWGDLGLYARYTVGFRPLSPARLLAVLDHQGLVGLQIWAVSRWRVPTRPVRWPGGWLVAESYLLLAEKRTLGLPPLRPRWPLVNFNERLYEPAARVPP